MFFLEFSCFSVMQWMLAIWSLILLPFLNPVCTSGCSQFTYCWSLTWMILSITLLVCEINVIVQYFALSVQFSSVAQLCPTLCDPMVCSMPGLPVHHQLQEFTQTHVHRVGDAIQPSHPLSSPSPPALNLSQHQGFFKWVNSSHQVAKVLELKI